MGNSSRFQAFISLSPSLSLSFCIICLVFVSLPLIVLVHTCVHHIPGRASQNRDWEGGGRSRMTMGKYVPPVALVSIADASISGQSALGEGICRFRRLRAGDGQRGSPYLCSGGAAMALDIMETVGQYERERLSGGKGPTPPPGDTTLYMCVCVCVCACVVSKLWV
ncbi:hypothetical protein LZ30DRAFT_705226, partial [Colletotrichum cereale]